MVNTVRSCIKPFLHKLMKLRGYQEKSIELNNPPSTTLHIWVRSKPNTSQTHQQALVLLHGFIDDGALQWQVQAHTLAKHFPTIIIPDLLFFGGSTTASPERSPRFQGDCLAEGLRQLGVNRCVLVGFSYGGIVGFQMAHNHPELVVGLVVTGSVPAMVESISSRTLRRLGFSCWSELLLPNSVEGLKVLLKFGVYKLPFWIPGFLYRHFLEECFSNRKERTELLEALVIRDEDVTLHKFQQSIHMLWGEEDTIITMEDAHNLKVKLGSETILKSINMAGHLAMLEKPLVFNNYLKELLATFNILHEDDKR